jgi:hypothetical protein
MAIYLQHDPLAALPEITQHPGSSRESSLTPPPDILDDLIGIVKHKLDSYTKIDDSDDTVKVLTPFVNNLSGEGVELVAGDL